MTINDFQEMSSESYANLNDLGETLVKFCKDTNPYLYFYLEKASIGPDYDGNVMVKYEATDIDGDNLIIAITIRGGEILCEPDKVFQHGKDAEGRNCRGLIAGVDRNGKPINGSTIGVDSRYISALMLLLTDLERYSTRAGVAVNRIIFPANSNDVVLTNVKPDKSAPGEALVYFDDTSKNMQELDAFVEERKTALGTEALLPVDTPVHALNAESYRIIDVDSGAMHSVNIMGVPGASYDDATDVDEMLMLVEGSGQGIVIEGSNGRAIDAASDLIIDLESGKVLGSNLYIVPGLTDRAERTSRVIAAKERGKKLLLQH